MNVSKLLATTFAAASVVGAIGFAYAQTTPANDTTAQSRPADKNMPANTMGSSQTMQPSAAQKSPQGSPDSGTPYSPATATDNTTMPANSTTSGRPAAPNGDTQAMSERAPQADRN